MLIRRRKLAANVSIQTPARVQASIDKLNCWSHKMLSRMLIRRGKLSINIYIQPPDRIGTNDNRLPEITFPQQNYIAVVDT